MGWMGGYGCVWLCENEMAWRVLWCDVYGAPWMFSNFLFPSPHSLSLSPSSFSPSVRRSGRQSTSFSAHGRETSLLSSIAPVRLFLIHLFSLSLSLSVCLSPYISLLISFSLFHFLFTLSFTSSHSLSLKEPSLPHRLQDIAMKRRISIVSWRHFLWYSWRSEFLMKSHMIPKMGMYPDDDGVISMTPIDDVADDVISIAGNVTREMEEKLKVTTFDRVDLPNVFHISSPGVTVQVKEIGNSDERYVNACDFPNIGLYLREYGYEMKGVPFPVWKENLESISVTPSHFS